MFTSLKSAAGKFLHDVRRSIERWKANAPPISPLPAEARTPACLRPLRRVLLTDGVNRTLFEEYAAHRALEHGDDETGWILLGLRDEDEAIVLATLPAGTQADASTTHVQFNSTAQALASRIVRQFDRRLTILGVVHTHPGSLRHPSDGDYQGDIEWVPRLRGKEGVFGIGTADARHQDRSLFAQQPRPNVQRLGELSLSWYCLRQADANYRPLDVSLTLGPDLARPLHPIWQDVERFAAPLDRLYRQQTGVTFTVLGQDEKPGLAVTLPLAEPASAVRVVIRDGACRYYVVQGDDVFLAECDEECPDRGVYLLLAELASQSAEERAHSDHFA